MQQTARAIRGRRAAYVLDDQIGFILRQAYQRNSVLFGELFGDELTPTQWAAIAKLSQVGGCSQNHLGRLIAMDAATVKGVVDRLMKRGLVEIGAQRHGSPTPAAEPDRGRPQGN